MDKSYTPAAFMKGQTFYSKTDPRNLASYSLGDAARYLQLPHATLRSWVIGRKYPTSKGDQFFRPLIEAPKSDNHLALSFMNLVEAHVLDAIRRTHGIALPKVRIAISFVMRKLGSNHPLAERSFETDGIDLFVHEYGQLINVSRDGQLVMKGVLEAYLERIERDSNGIAVRFFPFTRNRPAGSEVRREPRTVVIDPSVSYGRPVLIGTGIPTSVLAERYKAGDSINELSSDYALPTNEIEEAIRCELQTEAA
jgi:uncharacterized protein (DUF433 family)